MLCHCNKVKTSSYRNGSDSPHRRYRIGHFSIAYFLWNISTKNYWDPTTLARVTTKNVGIFYETQCTMGYDTLDVYPHVYLDWLQEETARWRAQMEEAVMRKSPSVAGSYTSVEAFVPRRRKTSKDKDYLSPCWSLSSSKDKDCEIATSKDMDCLPRGLCQSSLVAVFQQGQGRAQCALGEDDQLPLPAIQPGQWTCRLQGRTPLLRFVVD